jgi:Cu+-exporting ATPase
VRGIQTTSFPQPSPPSDGGEGEDKNTSNNFEIRVAAALARRSNHPLSQSVAKLYSDDFEFAGWREIRGSGVEAEFDSQTVRLGSLRWLKSSGVDLNPGASSARPASGVARAERVLGAPEFEENWTSRGATILGFAQGTKLVAMFALEDTLKNGAANVVKQLGDENLSVYLITGDNTRTAENIAKQTGIPRENVFAEIRPEEKSALVKKLQARGERVAFVGDGINDAPALEQADLGIAVSKASDVANEAADIILLKSEIHSIPEALGLARATLRTIKQNLFWAFFYNAAGIPLAALGFLSPVLCAAAMGFSDVIVIGNALRLRRWKK